MRFRVTKGQTCTQDDLSISMEVLMTVSQVVGEWKLL